MKALPSRLPLSLFSPSFDSPLDSSLKNKGTVTLHLMCTESFVGFLFPPSRTSSYLLRFPDGSEPSSLSFPESDPSPSPPSSSRKMSSYEGTPRSSSCLISSLICGRVVEGDTCWEKARMTAQLRGVESFITKGFCSRTAFQKGNAILRVNFWKFRQCHHFLSPVYHCKHWQRQQDGEYRRWRTLCHPLAAASPEGQHLPRNWWEQSGGTTNQQYDN